MVTVYPEAPALWLLGKQERLAAVPDLSQLQSCLLEYGFVTPVVLDGHFRVVAGCEHLLAACSLGIPNVPYVLADSLSGERLEEITAALADEIISAAWDSV